jgi:hypothetical protein
VDYRLYNLHYTPTVWGGGGGTRTKISRIPLLCNVQTSVSYPLVTEKVLSLGIRLPERETDHLPSFSAEVKDYKFIAPLLTRL